VITSFINHVFKSHIVSVEKQLAAYVKRGQRRKPAFLFIVAFSLCDPSLLIKAGLLQENPIKE
jgi:hypothetical protein